MTLLEVRAKNTTDVSRLAVLYSFSQSWPNLRIFILYKMLGRLFWFWFGVLFCLLRGGCADLRVTSVSQPMALVWNSLLNSSGTQYRSGVQESDSLVWEDDLWRPFIYLKSWNRFCFARLTEGKDAQNRERCTAGVAFSPGSSHPGLGSSHRTAVLTHVS